jgi:beta-galactosidase
MMFIGAEIFIEPGQTESEIHTWFSTMQTNGLGLTRIRMFENYMRIGETWDFNLFDIAFKAAEKYGIKIYANLFPETDFSDVGGFKFPRTQEHLSSIADYIKHVVQHFDQFDSLYGWVLINEPGSSGVLPDTEFTIELFQRWKSESISKDYGSNGYRILDFSEKRFLVDYNTWFLSWLSGEIRKYDTSRPIHVNNHDIFKNAAEYDFPSWRNFLTSLGGSAHASWHFDYFHRDQFGVAMSANAEILRSGAGPIPWFMTELQGGNNTYSGKQPICPTVAEIAQWLWINIGSGSEGGVFWCLNPRKSGFEAGEWAMLDFHNEPTDRLLMAAAVSKSISDNGEFFQNFKVQDSGISVLYVKESLWIEEVLQIEGAKFEGRRVGGVMKSALSYFEALSELGIHPSFNEISEYDFEQDDFHGRAIILSHQISIPSKYWQPLIDFVAKGGKLILDGLTAYYDENGYSILGESFPFSACFGASVTEFKLEDNLFQIQVEQTSLKAHLWKGTLKLGTATAITDLKDDTANMAYASRNFYGDGEVVWIPSLVGLGSRISKDYKDLCNLLTKELSTIIQTLPLSFAKHQPGMLLKLIRNENALLSVIINKSGEDQLLKLNIRDLVFGRVVFCSNQSDTFSLNEFLLKDEETLVVEWKPKP